MLGALLCSSIITASPKLLASGGYPAHVITREQNFVKQPAGWVRDQFGLRKRPEVSGVLFFGNKAANGRWKADQSELHFPEWKHGSLVRPVSWNALPTNAFDCPYVYGNEPIEVAFSPNSERSDLVRVSLPPNNLPAPVLEPVQVTVGKKSLLLRPVPPLGPAFPLAYELTVKGANPGETNLVGISSTPMPGQFASLALPQSGRALIRLFNWTEKMTFHCELMTAVKVPFTANYKISGDAKTYQQELTTDEGECLVEFRRELTSGGGRISMGGFEFYMVKGMAYPHEVGSIFEIGHSRPQPDLSSQMLAKLKNGERIACLGYKVIRRESFKLVLDLPKQRVPFVYGR
ncbi:MAG: hypothetical protein ABL962_00585 [Fimbriimonadaceae bacterium]